MPAHIVLFEVIERVFVESLYEPENVREVNPSIIFINVTLLPLSSVSIKILYKNTLLADVAPYIIIETYIVLLIPLILKENESALVELMYVLLFYRKDILSAFYAFLHPIHAVPESILVLTYTLFVILSYTIIFLSLFTI